MRHVGGTARAGRRETAKLLNPSIALLLQHSKATTPEDAVRSEARRVTDYARTLGWSGPPFDLTQLASVLGIQERAVRGMEQDALIRPRADAKGFEILWNPDVPETRRNFTFGHEITHTFFPDCATAIQYREPLHKCDPKKPVEILCDLGAAELLLPLAEFSGHVNELGVSLATVDSLRRTYVASREAVARRIATVTPEPCAFAFVSRRLSPREVEASRQLRFPGGEGPRPKYRVDMLFASASFAGERLPQHKSVPDESCVYRAEAQEDSFVERISEAVEVWPSGHGNLPRCHVQAMAIPSGGDAAPRALALLVQKRSR